MIGELKKKNDELELEVCEVRKLKGKWVDDSNALAELRIRFGALENEINALVVKNIKLEKSVKRKSFEDRDEENVGIYDEIERDIVESAPLQTNEPPSKRSKNAKGASSSEMSSYVIEGSQEIIKAGDKVILRPSKRKEPPYVGFVKKIIPGTCGSDTIVNLAWFYRPHEAAFPNKDFIGEDEFFYSSVREVQSAKTIISKCFVHTFKDYLNLCDLQNVGPLDFYCRYKYDPNTGTIFVPNSATQRVLAHCKCELSRNPDYFMI